MLLVVYSVGRLPSSRVICIVLFNYKLAVLDDEVLPGQGIAGLYMHVAVLERFEHLRE